MNSLHSDPINNTKSQLTEITKNDKINVIENALSEIRYNFFVILKEAKYLEEEVKNQNETYKKLYKKSSRYIKYINNDALLMLKNINSQEFLSKNGLSVNDINSSEVFQLIYQADQLKHLIFQIRKESKPELDPFNPPKLSDATVATIRKMPQQKEAELNSKKNIANFSTNKKYALSHDKEKIRELLKAKETKIKKYLGIPSEQVYGAQKGLVNFNRGRLSQIELHKEHHSRVVKGDEKARFGKIATGKNSPNLTMCHINKKITEINNETEPKEIENTDRPHYRTHQPAARFIALMGAHEIERSKKEMENNN